MNVAKLVSDTEGRCAEKGLPVYPPEADKPHSPLAWPASLLQNTLPLICSHVNHNKILSLCRGFSAHLPLIYIVFM
jgi:hypothetical protein